MTADEVLARLPVAGWDGPFDATLRHDAMKLDAAYQADGPRAAVSFPAGSTWPCFTGHVLHAALASHCSLEQTFHVPMAALAHPAQAPLRMLERLAGRALV